jgi:S1-C subfamily serine protease
MHDPARAPPPTTARRNTASSAALLLIGALLGGGVGGVAGAQLANRTNGPLPLPTDAPRQVTIEESSLIVDAVRDVLPSVVTVVNKGPGGEPQSSGSGVVIDQQRGYVVTNSHVVEQLRSTEANRDVDVILSNGTRLGASVIGNDPYTDVAVLKVQGALPAQAVLADTEDVPLGAQVVAIGSPGADERIFQNTVTTGIVSAKGRRLPRSDLRDVILEDLVQTDAAINPGNSGGPLVWASARQVIGLNTLVFRRGGEEGLGFAVSSNTVRRISDELIADGRIVRGFIGIAYDENNAQYAALNRLPTSKGVVILEVRSGTPAAAAGLRARDVITRLNGQEIDQEHPLRTLLLSTRPGDRASLTVLRDGREQEITLTLGAPTSAAAGA